MPSFRLSNRTDVTDFVNGLTCMGTGGGGGAPGPSIDLLMAQIEAGKELRIIELGELPKDAWTVSVAGLGGRPPANGPSQAELQELGLIEPKYERFAAQAAAIRQLEQFAHVSIAAIVCGELGSGNTPIPILIGLQLGLPTVDGDYAGRAIPEIGQATPDVLGRSSSPFSYVDRWGNALVVKQASSPAMIDRIGRMLCIAGYGGVAFAGYLATAADAEETFVPHTLSRALAIGRAGRIAKEQGRSAAAAMAETAGGWVLFTGMIDRTERDDSAAYMFGFGTHVISGTESSDGKTLRLWYKNEHHLTWIDDQVFVTSPDCLAVIDLDSGEPLPNSSISVGRRVALIGWPANRIHRLPRGIEVLGPKHFGFDIEYVPIAERVPV